MKFYPQAKYLFQPLHSSILNVLHVLKTLKISNMHLLTSAETFITIITPLHWYWYLECSLNCSNQLLKRKLIWDRFWSPSFCIVCRLQMHGIRHMASKFPPPPPTPFFFVLLLNGYLWVLYRILK